MTGAALRKLQAEWDNRLRSDGFQDLESRDRDAPLSNRGKLHAVTDDDNPALMERIEHGAAYTEWSQDVLHRLPRTGAGHRTYRIWKLHTEGDSMKTIAGKMDLNFHVVRAVVNKTEERYRKCEKNEPKRPSVRQAAMRKLVRQISTETLVGLVAAMLKTLQTS